VNCGPVTPGRPRTAIYGDRPTIADGAVAQQEVDQVAETSLFRNEPNQVKLAAGEYLFRAGDDAEHMYAVIDGEVEIVREGNVVELRPENTIFGELAMIDPEYNHTRAADARARTDCVLAEIDRNRFLFVLRTNGPFAITLMNHLAERIRRGW
jgi:CRP/FNR family cyclic AMP-dependent transcriptional regulator